MGVRVFTETAIWLFFALILDNMQKYHRCAGKGTDTI